MTASEEVSAAVSASGLIHRYYRKVVGLDRLDLTLARGAFHAIVGPDGVGKSTLLGLMATAKRLQQGKLIVLGQDVSRAAARRDLAHRIAFMPQGLGRNLYPDLTIAEHLDYFARLFGISPTARRGRGDMLLLRTGLAGFEGRRARNLSGGMKQKLALCCSLIHEPELLILDEPTTGVDPLSRREFWELLRGTHRERPELTVICSTDYVEEVTHFDSAVFVDAGRVLLQDSVAAVRAYAPDRSLSAAYAAILARNEAVDQRPEPEAAPRRPEVADVVIEARQLTKRFGSFTAVDGIELTVRRGEIFAFLGPNGCGKSTTMRILTGLSLPSAGSVRIFGKEPRAGSLMLRSAIGYMSQSYSLYGELSPRRNLRLNLQLQHSDADREARIEELLKHFDLAEKADRPSSDLPLGMKQRLSLACAVAHRPQLLILDEPTSGVDPAARDAFWAELRRLSAEEGVTIFVSTHYLSEAERCDRVAFMDVGRILAVDTPKTLKANTGTTTLEDAFTAYLRTARGTPQQRAAASVPATSAPANALSASLQRLLATATREAKELWRDPVRLAFALVAAVFLLFVMAFGISLDVSDIRVALYDQDQSPASRGFAQELDGSRYFTRVADVATGPAADRMLVSRSADLVIEIPHGFGRDLAKGRSPEIAFWLDAASPNLAETSRSYAEALYQGYLADQTAASPAPRTAVMVPEIELRFRYNPTVASVVTFAPGSIGILLLLTPAMLMAISVTREKELGPILNLYTTPLRVYEFMLGKQLPYVIIGFANFLLLYAIVRWFFDVPMTGSVAALFLAALLQCVVATGFGMVIAGFTRSQVAALTAAQVLSIIPSLGYSGLITPVGSMEGASRIIAYSFPSSYFHGAVMGSFLKGLGFRDLAPNLWALLGFGILFSIVSIAITRKQER